MPKAILLTGTNTLVDTWRVAYDSINIAPKFCLTALINFTTHLSLKIPHVISLETPEEGKFL
jgi:hypothetical protein